MKSSPKTLVFSRGIGRNRVIRSRRLRATIECLYRELSATVLRYFPLCTGSYRSFVIRDRFMGDSGSSSLI